MSDYRLDSVPSPTSNGMKPIRNSRDFIRVLGLPIQNKTPKGRPKFSDPQVTDFDKDFHQIVKDVKDHAKTTEELHSVSSELLVRTRARDLLALYGPLIWSESESSTVLDEIYYPRYLIYSNSEDKSRILDCVQHWIQSIARRDLGRMIKKPLRDSTIPMSPTYTAAQECRRTEQQLSPSSDAEDSDGDSSGDYRERRNHGGIVSNDNENDSNNDHSALPTQEISNPNFLAPVVQMVPQSHKRDRRESGINRGSTLPEPTILASTMLRQDKEKEGSNRTIASSSSTAGIKRRDFSSPDKYTIPGKVTKRARREISERFSPRGERIPQEVTSPILCSFFDGQLLTEIPSSLLSLRASSQAPANSCDPVASQDASNDLAESRHAHSMPPATDIRPDTDENREGSNSRRRTESPDQSTRDTEQGIRLSLIVKLKLSFKDPSIPNAEDVSDTTSSAVQASRSSTNPTTIQDQTRGSEHRATSVQLEPEAERESQAQIEPQALSDPLPPTQSEPGVQNEPQAPREPDPPREPEPPTEPQARTEPQAHTEPQARLTEPFEDPVVDDDFLVSVLIDLLDLCEPERQDVASMQETVVFFQSMVERDEAKLRDVFGDSFDQYQTTFNKWLECIKAVIQFRTMTGAEGDRTMRDEYLAQMPPEERVIANRIAYNGRKAVRRWFGEQGFSFTRISHDIALASYNVGRWDHFPFEYLAERWLKFNERLFLWFGAK